MSQLFSPTASSSLSREEDISLKKERPSAQVWAYRLLWVTFILFFASTGAGKVWDRFWHATLRFDTFWSPSHFFVFVMTLLTGVLVATIALTPRLLVWFGPVTRVPFLKFKVPGTLVMLSGG